MVERQGSRSEAELFKPVNLGRVSEAIVGQIQSLIRQGRLNPGDRLPSERELSATFGVSRVTVREALRVLEAGGLVRIRVGARGGAFVTAPSSDRLAAGFADLLHLSPLTAGEVTEARKVFELGILPLIIDRATAQDIQLLLELVDEADAALLHDAYTVAHSAAFHVQVAACTHNNAIEMIVQSFHGPMLMSLREAWTVAPLMGPKGVQEHRGYVEAIRDRDIEKARSLMTIHLDRTAARLTDAT